MTLLGQCDNEIFDGWEGSQVPINFNHSIKGVDVIILDLPDFYFIQL